MSHKCPINGCATILADHLPICGPHYRLVPPRMAAPLLSKSNRLERMKRTCKNTKLLLNASKEYADALAAVVAYVNGQLAGVEA